MAISNVFEKLGRAMFEAPFGADRISKDAPELAEIRLAVLDAVKARSHRVAGSSVFPFNLVRIHLLGVPEDQTSTLESDFLANYFAEELRSSLGRSGFRYPRDLRVQIQTTSKLPAPGEKWLTVETEIEQAKPVETVIAAHQPAKLVIVNGTANHAEFLLDKARTNIGRTVEVYRASGPSRRNDLAFTEDSEINRTVSREHAHILYSEAAGEYRIVNDRSYKGEGNCGIWIVRGGLSQAVHRGSRGTVLKHGDEIHLGTAVIRFESC